MAKKGAMIGSIICFKVGDFLGRRRELLVAALLFFSGAILEGVSGLSFWSGDWGLVVLMAGRVLYGLGCGFAMHGVSGFCVGKTTRTQLARAYASFSPVFRLFQMSMFCVGTPFEQGKKFVF